MARFSRAAVLNCNERGLCDLHIHTEHHSCSHRRNGIFDGGGSPNVFFEGVAAIREGDGGVCNCVHGGVFKASEGSNTVFVNNKPLARIKDMTSCTQCGMEGYITTGCSSVYVGD